MPIVNAIASLAVRDLDAASEWYERLLGRPADATPMPGLAEGEFERGGWLQVYHGPERAGSGTVTLAVTSLDEILSVLEQGGFAMGDTIETESARVIMVKDPDGNSIAFAEALRPGIAH